MKKLTKEELELMSYNDIAYLLLKDKNEQTTPELFKKICELLGLSDSMYEKKIGDFYTALTTDQRFTLLDVGKWDLKENHSVKNLNLDEYEDLDDIDPEEMINEEEDIEEKDNMYDDNSDDDTDDVTEEYKDLVIVDEDDLDQVD